MHICGGIKAAPKDRRRTRRKQQLLALHWQGSKKMHLFGVAKVNIKQSKKKRTESTENIHIFVGGFWPGLHGIALCIVRTMLAHYCSAYNHNLHTICIMQISFGFEHFNEFGCAVARIKKQKQRRKKKLIHKMSINRQIKSHLYKMWIYWKIAETLHTTRTHKFVLNNNVKMNA